MYSVDTFTHNGIDYNLPRLKMLARRLPIINVPIVELLWILNYDRPREKRIVEAKLRYPLLIVDFHGQKCVIDGIHRLEKYRRGGFKKVPTRTVTNQMMEICVISSRSEKEKQ